MAGEKRKGQQPLEPSLVRLSRRTARRGGGNGERAEAGGTGEEVKTAAAHCG